MRLRRFLATLAPAVQAYVILWAVEPLRAVATASPPPSWCEVDNNPGVLISGHVTRGGFACYVSHLLTENMPYIILVAVVLVVVSGVQYMLSQGNATAQGAAKTRIVGIITGVIFYFLLRYILPLIVGGVTI